MTRSCDIAVYYRLFLARVQIFMLILGRVKKIGATSNSEKETRLILCVIVGR